MAVPDKVVLLLSIFQTITTCTLQSSKAECSDLRPLSSLPLLTRLALEYGGFSHLEAASHLTALSLDNAHVVCTQDFSCVTSIVELSLKAAELLDFHCESVSACARLESLVLDSACMGAITDDEDRGYRNWQVAFCDDERAGTPPDISALTALTNLELTCLRHDMQLG